MYCTRMLKSFIIRDDVADYIFNFALFSISIANSPRASCAVAPSQKQHSDERENFRLLKKHLIKFYIIQPDFQLRVC